MSNRIELFRRVDGEAVPTIDALTLIVGKPVDEVRRAVAEGPPNLLGLPKEWLQAGRRRTSQAKRGTGRRTWRLRSCISPNSKATTA